MNDFQSELSSLIDINELQKIQDAFSEATGVASIITKADGTPITAPSRFCRLCSSIIRKTEKGKLNCFRSDAVIGVYNPLGPNIQPCLSAGLWDAGASIMAGTHHIANWLIGQVRTEDLDEDRLLKYADEIGADKKDFLIASREVPLMSKEKFTAISNFLFLMANQISKFAFDSYQNALIIKEKEETQRQLKASEKQYRQIVETCSEGIITIDANSRITFINKRTEEMTGFSANQILGYPIFNMVASEQVPLIMAQIENRKKGLAGSYELDFVNKSGRRITVLLSASPIMDENKCHQGSLAMINDITEKKRAETALATEKERLAVTLRSIGDGVIATDVSGRITLMNPVAEQMTGWQQTEAISKPLSEIFVAIHPATKEKYQNPIIKVLQQSEVVPLPDNILMLSRNGREYNLSGSASPIRHSSGQVLGVVLVFRDITIEARLHSELQKSAKLDSVGILAGGIAHDFNNLLGGIAGNIGLAVNCLKNNDHEKILKYLEETERVTIRARDLTQRLLTFSQGGAPVKKIINPKKLIEETALFALSGSHNKCIFSGPDTWCVEADSGQISQVINNLVINADQAMPNPGQIEIITENIWVSDQNGLPLESGPFLKISVKDSGVGIAPEIINKIFDPFFTTKQKGSGLGLSSVYSIIRAHQGHIQVESTLHTGSTFTLYLPASPSSSIAATNPSKNLPKNSNLRILVMDDEEMLRNLLVDSLSEMGHSIVAVSEGKEALAALKNGIESGLIFDIAILDLTVPGGMGGKEAVGLLKEISPKLKIIASSGYSTDRVMTHANEYGFDATLTKPFRLAELEDCITRLSHEK